LRIIILYQKGRQMRFLRKLFMNGRIKKNKNLRFPLPAFFMGLIFSSCLQAVYNDNLPDYTPAPDLSDIRSASFPINAGSDTLIITLIGGVYRPVSGANPLAIDQFLLNGSPLASPPAAFNRDSDTQVTIRTPLRPQSDNRITVQAAAQRTPAKRIAVRAVQSGVWTTVTGSLFGTTTIWNTGFGGGKFMALGDNGKMAYSADGVNWTAIQAGSNAGQSQFSNTIRAVAFGNGRYVAAGYDRRMAFSTNGVDWEGWTESKFPGSGILCLSYGGGRFAAAGDNGKTIWSGDGLSWFSGGDSGFGTNSILGLAHGGNSGSGIFVAVGTNGKIAYSVNGAETWSPANSVFGSSTDGSSDINAAAYGNNKFVAGSNGGRLAYSANGINWTLVENSAFGSSGILGISFGGGVFVAVGHNGKMASSSDGITWKGGTLPELSGAFDGKIQGICFGGDKFVVCGNTYGGNESILAYGYGAPELGGTLPPENLSSETFSSAAGNNALVITLVGGSFKNDTIPPIHPAIEDFSLLPGGAGFAGINAGSAVTRSSDTQVIISGLNPSLGGSGQKIMTAAAALASRAVRITVRAETVLHWTGAADAQFGNKGIRGIGFGTGIFIAVGDRGTIARSGDGISWTKIYDDTNSVFHRSQGSDRLSAISYGAGKFVAVGTWGQRGYSTDGSAWTVLDNSGPPFTGWGSLPVLNSVSYGGGKFIAAGDNGNILASTGGESWTVVSTGTNGPFSGWSAAPVLNGVTYGGDKFITVGENGNILASTGGENWTVVSTGTSGPFSGWTNAPVLYSAAYGSGGFVAVGQWGTIVYSTGGLSWTVPAERPFGSGDIFSVSYGSGTFAAAGDNGLMAKSNDGIHWTVIPAGTNAGESGFTGGEKIMCIGFGILSGGGRFAAGGNAYEGNAGRITYTN
jgi:hypothetical protein